MQIKIGAIGETVKGLEDIIQEVWLILSTPLGSIPHMPSFGSRIYEYIDKPQNIARPLIIAEAYRAIEENSTRFKPLDVKLKSISEDGKMAFMIKGVITDPQTEEEVIFSVLTDLSR